MESEFLAAINAEDVDLVKKLLDQGAKVNPSDDEDDPAFPLEVGAHRGNPEIVKLLLEHGAEVDRVSDEYPTPLMLACSLGHLEVARVLIEHGAEVSLANWSTEETALKAASRNGHTEIVRLMLENGAAVDHVTDEDHTGGEYFEEHTALMAACLHDQTDVARILLEHGANVNLCNSAFGMTPLMGAAALGNTDLVDLLLQYEAKLERCDDDGETALLYACRTGKTKTGLFLIEKGADLESHSRRWGTPLMAASSTGHEETVRMLIDRGADINYLTNYGDTALLKALTPGHQNTASYLLNCGAALTSKSIDDLSRLSARRLVPDNDIEVPDRAWDQPSELMWASFWGMTTVVPILLERGASVDAWDGSGRTALMVAAGEGHVEVIKILLVHSASMDAQDADGLSALMWASCWGQEAAVQTLLEAGAQSGLKDRIGNTALDWASRAGHESVCQILSSSSVTSQKTDKKPDVDLLIRQAYPFPLAYPYRSMENLSSPSELYKEMCRIAENLLAFLGSISLALTKTKEIHPSSELLLKSFQGGISPGDWVDLTKDCLEKIGAERADLLTNELFCLFWKGTKRKKTLISEELDQIVRWKNDFKHDRWPVTQSEHRQACKQLQESLTSCMTALSFFINHAIRQVIDQFVDRETLGHMTISYLLVGDHPVLPKETVSSPDLFPRDTLHLQITEGMWIPLYPFLTVQECPKCGHTEVYFIDKWNRKDRHARLKSFERGHDLESPEVGRALQKWLEANSIGGCKGVNTS